MRTRMQAIALAVVFFLGTSVPLQAQSVIPGPCEPGLLPGGARSLIWVQAVGWNGQLVVFARGGAPLRLRWDSHD
jgi:hypothetical protein